MKKIISILLLTAIILSLSFVSGCGYEYQELNLSGNYENNLKGTVLNVYNWGEYISDGTDGSMDVNKEFERITGIKVNYTTFESNESMFSRIQNGGVSYDIIIPSDYMIARLISEDMLLPIDTSKLSNYGNIGKNYLEISKYFDPENKFSVPYCVGMVGIIYNTSMIDEDIDSWGVFWDKRYKNQTLMFNNPRDAFMIAQIYNGTSVNSTNLKEWDAAAELLKSQKKYLQSYVMDEVYGKMETGEAAIAPYYAGDYLTMADVNDDLAFVYPKEGTNIFIDSICIPKCCKNYEAALLYINFLLESDIALANADYIGYASPNVTILDRPEYFINDPEYPLADVAKKILYPSDDEMPDVVEYYGYLDDKIRKYYENLWIDIKLY